MNLLALNRLWQMSAAGVIAAGLLYFFSGESPRWRSPAATTPPPIPPAVQKKTAPLERRDQLSYTYVGPATPVDTAVGKASPLDNTGSSNSADNKPPSRPRPTAASKDTSLAFGRREPAASTTGAIPDLEIQLAGVDLMRVIRHYGYVPAIKTSTRLLGKISGEQFLPITPEERAGYARRGRSGAGHPEAERWLRRVAAELQMPVEEMRFIFLVPVQTEQLFIAAELAALAAAGQSREAIALVRAHFDNTLAIVVDELITKTGETIIVDSVRVHYTR